ncbi:elongation factor G, partial [Aliarcobacter butzleri]
EGTELTEDENVEGHKKKCLAMEITPMVCGTSFKNKGVQPLLDAVAMYLPAPTEVAVIKGVTQDGVAIFVPSNDKGEVA